MASTRDVLILAPSAESGGALAAAFSRTGRAADVFPTVAAAVAALPVSPPALVVVEATLADAVADLQRLGEPHAAGFLLGVTGVATAADWRRALLLGCTAVVTPNDAAGEIEAVCATVATRRRAVIAERRERQRLEQLGNGLRQRCVQQASRFQETQETFFLDLSRMMTILTNIMDGIVFVDRDGHVSLLNPVAEDLLACKSFVAVGKPLAALTGRRELLDALVVDHARLQGTKEVVQTVEVHHREQDLLYIQCLTSRVLDYRGEAAGTLSVLKDVTAEFKTDQLKNQYLSIVAHELRTPLTGIKTFATMLAKGRLGELGKRQADACESIREQSLRLEHQIDKLINLGNLESADYGQDREVVSLEDFVAGMLAPFEQPARDRRIDLVPPQVPAGVQLFVDRADLRRACQALIENAIKFTPDGGHVQVSLSGTADGTVRFGVRDDGIGIDPRYHRRIFEKFFQVEDPLTRHHGGAGLGLFVARGIVEAHGSRIEVLSQLGQGADFSFVMPVHRPAAVGASAGAPA